MEAPTPRTRYEQHLSNAVSGVRSDGEGPARQRSDSTTFGDPTATNKAATNADDGNDASGIPARREVPRPPPPPGSGLTQACSLVKEILDQVTLNDCPPDNEEEAIGVVGLGGTTRTMSMRPKSPGRQGTAMSASPRNHQGKKHRAPFGGVSAGAATPSEQGFSRQRHVIPPSMQPLFAPGRGGGTNTSRANAAAAPTALRGRVLTSPTASVANTISSTGTVAVPSSQQDEGRTNANGSIRHTASVDSSSLGSPVSIEGSSYGGGHAAAGGGGDVAGDIEPMKTWESDGGSLLALIQLKSSDSMDYDDGEDGTAPSTRCSTPATASPAPAVPVPPASATTAPLLSNYSASGQQQQVGPYSARALRKTETRMGTVSLAALCARTLDTVAAVGTDANPNDHAARSTSQEEANYGDDEHVEKTPDHSTISRKNAIDVHGSGEDVGIPPAVSQVPSPRRMLRMFGSEYARHLSSTPFSPPGPRGSSARAVGAGGTGAGGSRSIGKSSRSSKMKNRLDKFSRSDPSIPLPPTTPGKPTTLVDDASPFSPESPLGIVQTESNVSNLSGLTAQTNLPLPRPPTGASSLPKESFAIENQTPDILTGAITDIIVTVGNERPPKGYYRIAQSSSGIDLSTLKRAKTGKTSSAKSGKSALTQLSRKPVALYINVKKEANWDRAVQRPCVTAMTVIYPDRNEFVPPGFCVVRRYKNGGDKKDSGSNSPNRKKRGGGSSSSSKSSGGASSAGSGGGTIPANLNFGTAGERVYLCYRRSREGNPLTGILPLAPSAQESVPEGYTVLERTPRNFVADINHGAGPALFLAFRQRLANLEPLRPLPLVLAVYYSNLQLDSKGGDAAAAAGIAAACGLASAPDRTRGKVGGDGEVIWERRLRAYYCTGGTVVPSEVGKFHVMDRSTHPLLSPSSVTNRLTLIEASRRQKAAEAKGAEQSKNGAPSSPKSDGSVYSSPFKSSDDRPRDNSAYSTPSPQKLDRGISLLDSRHSNNDLNGSFYADEASVVSNSSASIHSASRAKGLSWNASSAESLSLRNISGHGNGPPRAIRGSPMPSPYANKKSSVFRDSDDNEEDESERVEESRFDSDAEMDLFGKKGGDSPRAKARTIFTHPDPAMQSCFNAMDFIPTVDSPSLSEASDPVAARGPAVVLLQARTSVLTPILTACYTQHGGSSLMAVDGLTRLLNETDFFLPDVITSISRHESECSTRLTLLDLAVQVVCDVATSSSRETSFVSCIEFVGDALRLAGGNLNARTIGYVLRFYLFVFYFGASIPTAGNWPNDGSDSPSKKTKGETKGGASIADSLVDTILLDDGDDAKNSENNTDISDGGLPSLRKKRGYLSGGAPQAAALALKDLITVVIGRMRVLSPEERRDIIAMATADFKDTKSSGKLSALTKSTIAMFIGEAADEFVNDSTDRVEMTNFTQLALHQVHRSGGSELFWHDMMTSCGVGLFGRYDASEETKFRFVVSFSMLASLVKVSSGKVRRVAQSSNLVPRDVASKILSLELLLHYLERWRDLSMSENLRKGAEDLAGGRPPRGNGSFYDPQKDDAAFATMAYAVRRLVVTCLLSNTSSGLENRRVFRRVARIVSELWCHPYYRYNLKLELGVLIEQFFVKMLRLGPQVLPPKRLKEIAKRLSGHGSDSPLLEEFDTSLLAQQLDVLIEVKRWFSSDPKDVLELFLNFDIVDVSGKSNVPMLPGSYWKITQRLCESLCTLAEEAGDIVSETIRATQMSGAGDGGGTASSAAALSSAVVAGADFAEMAEMREGARLIQEKAFEAISQVVKCFMQCAALTSGDRYERIKGKHRTTPSGGYNLPSFSSVAATSDDTDPPTRPMMNLTIDTSRPHDDETRSIASTIRDDESAIIEIEAAGRAGWRPGAGVPSSPLRMPKSTKAAKSPLRSTSTRHSGHSPGRALDSCTSADMVEYWQTSLAERRRMVMSPMDPHHMSNFASPDIRITPMAGGSKPGDANHSNGGLPPLSPTPRMNANRPPPMSTVKEDDKEASGDTPLKRKAKNDDEVKSTTDESSINPKVETQKTEEKLQVALDIMATKGLKKAIEYLLACNFIAPSARDVASFLRLHQAHIDPEALGEYLGEGGRDGADVEYWNLIRFNYVRAISFVGMNVEQGLRHFLTSCGFRLPGEAQRIDRIISTFAQCYWEDNAGDHIRCPFKDQDTVFLISFAIIMLNTDLHSVGISGIAGSARKQRKKMTKSEFLNNLRGVESSEDLSRDYLSAIYDSIESHAIEIYVAPNGRGASSIRSGSTEKSRYSSSAAPSRGGTDNNGADEDLTTMIKALVGNVKPAQELLRGVAVQRHPFLTIADYDYGQEEGAANSPIIPRELVRNAVGVSWHHFHLIINNTLDTAHLDSKGLESCLDVLKYALCATICLDMPTERAAFITQLARVKFFKETRGMEDEEEAKKQRLQHHDHHAYQKEDWYKMLEGYCSEGSSDESKDAAVQMVYDMIRDIHTSLHTDSKLRRDMKRVARRIRKGELLLNDPSRAFIKEGDLVKRANTSGRNAKYRFFLFSDVLVYAHKSSAGDYKIHEELPLYLLKITDKFTGAARKTNRAFHIRHPRKSFMVFAVDEATKISWMEAINEAVSKDMERKARLEGARLASAAVER